MRDRDTQTQLTLRWNNRKSRFRPAGETINPRDYEVVAMAGDSEAKAFVATHHYSGSYPAARFRFGLYRDSQLCGVAVFSHPVNDRTLLSVFPGDPLESVELGRFVLLTEVPGNGETWFLARAFDFLRKQGLRGVISFSDPIPRTDESGDTVFIGHHGLIYQAHNGVYLGRSTARTLRLLPNGVVLSDRTIQKIRSGDRGWRYAAKILECHGADPCPEEARVSWLQTWLPKLTRRLPHPGNLKYAWGLQRKALTLTGLPYPKREMVVP